MGKAGLSQQRFSSKNKWKDKKKDNPKMHFNRFLLMAFCMSLAIWMEVEAKPEPQPDFGFSSLNSDRGFFDPLGTQFNTIMDDVLSTLKCSYEEFSNNLHNILSLSGQPAKPLDNLSKCMRNFTKYTTTNLYEK